MRELWAMDYSSVEGITEMTLSDLMMVGVPEGEFGSARVARFEVSEADSDFDRMRSMFSFGGRRYTPAGVYTKLLVNGQLWMSDTPDERSDHCEPLFQAQHLGARTALVTGLGLGMVVGGLLQLESIESVTVVELNTDVTQLVGWYYQQMAANLGKSFEVVTGDAMNPSALFHSGSHWDVAWHDIWANICADDYEEHKLIRRRYGRRVSWQGVWCGDEVRRAARQDAREEARLAEWWS